MSDARTARRDAPTPSGASRVPSPDAPPAPAVETAGLSSERPGRSDRLRIALVAVLAVAVMGGVVASALVARSHAHDDGVDADPTALVSTSHPPSSPLHGRMKPMPGGCEVDPKSPPVFTLDLPDKTIDLGMLKQGEKVQKQVTVRNTGTGVLCVSDIETSCGCVKADWDGDARVAPAAAGSFTIRVDTTGKEGTQKKWVTLYTNDPKQPTVSIYVNLEVRLGIVLGSAPGFYGSLLVLGTHASGRPATGVVRLKSPKEEREWHVLSVESIAPPDRRSTFRWEMTPAEPNDPIYRCYDLKITHPGRVEIGRDSQALLIRTDHPERPEIRIEAELTVETKFYASPPRGTFGFVRVSDAPPTRLFEIRPGEPGTEFEVKSAKLEGEGFVVGQPRKTKEGWAVDVRYDGQKRGQGQVAATLVISIDDPELPELRIPLAAVATGG